jgi:hypothetical protein
LSEMILSARLCFLFCESDAIRYYNSFVEQG